MTNETRIEPTFRRWLGRNLLSWFRVKQRALPWRETRDPYAIWISEVMLQQTQVAAVIPYFHRFLNALPTVQALAAAQEETVLRLWEGLGYYHRARNLHRAARQMTADHKGQIPNDANLVRGLPGFGRYTTNAVLSQAFDQRLPILEANSVRLLCRLFALRGNPRSSPLQQELWRLAEKILPRRQVGEFNQALMELGALVCTVADPGCPRCPLRNRCAALREGLQNVLPELPPRPASVEVEEVAMVVWRGDKVLIGQRPPSGRWPGLWEFPHGPVGCGKTHHDEGAQLLVVLTGLQAELGSEITVIRHGITRYRIRLVCLDAKYVAGKFQSAFYQKRKWVKPAELHEYPFSSPQRKLATIVGQPRQRELF